MQLLLPESRFKNSYNLTFNQLYIPSNKGVMTNKIDPTPVRNLYKNIHKPSNP